MVPCMCLCPLSTPNRRFVGNFFDSPDTFRCIRVLATVVAQEGGGESFKMYWMRKNVKG